MQGTTALLSDCSFAILIKTLITIPFALFMHFKCTTLWAQALKLSKEIIKTVCHTVIPLIPAVLFGRYEVPVDVSHYGHFGWYES